MQSEPEIDLDSTDYRNETEASRFWIDRRTTLKGIAALGALSTGLTLGASSAAASHTSSGGPVVLMGIDAEDGGLGAHGPISAYQTLVTDILTNVTNGNSGITVIGGKPGTHTEEFWNAIGSGTGETVTYVNGGTDIASHDFSGTAMVGVVSSVFETRSGGLTNDENDAWIGRAADLATFVNGGGGLLGLSQDDLDKPWVYLGDLGSFTVLNPSQYSDIDPTAEGLAVGVSDDLDVCCWHDVFTAWPAFLNVLAWRAGSRTEAAALGGAQVVIGCEPTEVALIAGQDEEIGTVTVLEDGDDISVTYSLNDDWYMTESHLHLAADCDDIPQTGSGNPMVGRFDFGSAYDPAVQEDTIVVDQAALGFGADDLVCVAAHAAVFKDMNDNGSFDEDVDREETAWGEGDRFTERGNWAMHFEYEVCD